MDATAERLLETLLKTQARQALLLSLLRSQRKTSEPEPMMRAASEMVGNYLGVDRAGFVEIRGEISGPDSLIFTEGWTAGRLPLLENGTPAPFPGDAYLAEARAGRCFGINDVATDPLTAGSGFSTVGTRSLIQAPMFRNGVWVAGFYVHHSAVRVWTTEEIALVRDAGEQTWDAVERARAVEALRKSEERANLALEAGGGVGTWDWDLLSDRVFASERFASLFPVDAGSAGSGAPVVNFLAAIHPEDRARVSASIQSVIGSGEDFLEEYRAAARDGSVRWVQARGRVHRDAAGRAVRFPGVLVDITERKQIEMDLRQQWQTFDTALSHTPDHIYIFDSEGRFRYANHALLELWQKTLPEIIGKNFFELNYPRALAERVHAQIREIAATGKPLRDQTRFAGPDGNFHVFDYIFVPVPGEDGRVDTIAGSTRDITEQSQAELLIEEDRRRWRDLLLQVPAAICVLRGPQHRLEWFNEDYLRLTGRSAESLQGKTVLEALPEAGSQGFVRLLDEVYRTGEPFLGHEVLFRVDKGGETLEDVYVNFVYLATRNTAGEIDGILAHIIEVTAMVTARKRIEDSEARFRQLADSMPQFVWTTTPEGRNDYYNERWYAFTGFDRELKDDESWISILHADDQQRCFDTWRECIASGEPFQIEIRLWDRQHARWRWFMSRAIAARDASGRIVKWFGTTIDIDEQKTAQEALLQTQKLESIGLLAGGIAHDFNNLLVGILGGASFALDTIPPSDPAFEMLRNVVDAGEQAAHLTRQILAYSGKGRFIVEPVNLSAMARQTRQLISASIPKTVEVRLDLDDRLPTVETDTGQMQQVMMNLIINAAEAVGEAEGAVTVRTRAETIFKTENRRSVDGTKMAPGLYAVLEVQDTGSGIDAQTLTKIFDPFFTTKFTGRGLGLAAVSGVIRRHRGGMEVVTELGRGSTFRVLLPASTARQTDAVPVANETPGRGSETVLVIDDEAVVRKVAQGALERSGYGVIVSSDGAEGLEQLRANPDIRLVLLDMSMPGMTGRRVLEELRLIRPRMPVVICSGYSDDEVHRQFSGLEMAGILQKPFTAQALTAKIRSVLDVVDVPARAG